MNVRLLYFSKRFRSLLKVNKLTYTKTIYYTCIQIEYKLLCAIA